jgi:hypothetical protein
MPWDARRARRMEQERPHQQRSSKADRADLLQQARSESWDLILGDLPARVRSRQNTQSALLLAAGIEMQSHRKHVLQDRCRWLDVEHFRLHRPRSKAIDFDSFPHSNCHVLMSRNLPVCIRNFVEQNASDGKEMCSENRFDQHSDSLGICQFPHLGRHVQEIADGKDSTTLPHRSCVADSLKSVQEIVNFLTRENIFHDCKPVGLHAVLGAGLSDHNSILWSCDQLVVCLAVATLGHPQNRCAHESDNHAHDSRDLNRRQDLTISHTNNAL